MPRPTASAPHTPKPRWHYPLAAAACGATTVVTMPLHDWLEPVNAVMLFLLTVVLVAARLGRGPAVMASFLSVGLFDFFYVPPRFSFAVSDIQYLLTFAVMLTVALVIGHLATGMRQRAEEAQQAARRAQALHALAHQLAGALTAEQVLHHLQAFMQDQLGADLHLWQPGLDHGLVLLHGEDTRGPAPSSSLTLLARSIAQDSARPRAHHVQDEQGAQGSDDSAGTHHVLLPLTGSTRNRGVMMVSLPASAAPGAQATLRQHGLLAAEASGAAVTARLATGLASRAVHGS